jgi:hypothetical protein
VCSVRQRSVLDRRVDRDSLDNCGGCAVRLRLINKEQVTVPDGTPLDSDPPIDSPNPISLSNL